MALKFLNKKGWHTGSLRNIENVWKAEQKHDAEQKKLEELRKQIQDERERSEFRLLQEQAGLVPKQERLEFLYDSGLSVGKGSSSSAGMGGVAFKALEEALPNNNNSSDASSSAKQASAPGALFEDKPQSANDVWRKLHSDPLLLIRQREQEALARIKNNPVQMALIRKSVEGKKEEDKSIDKEHSKKPRSSETKHHKHSSSQKQSDSEKVGVKGEKWRKTSHKSSKYDEHYDERKVNSDDESSDKRKLRGKNDYRGSKYRELLPSDSSPRNTVREDGQDTMRNNHDHSKSRKRSMEGRINLGTNLKERKKNIDHEARRRDSSASLARHDSYHKRRNIAPKLSEEERAARLREMQADAELHEEQRWKRLRKAEEDDAREATHATYGGRNFLDAAQKSVYGAAKGGSSTIEESVRRRTHYSQGRSEVGDGNAFRR